ncbi:hypothetical protein [Dokdonella koreensis]|jgi:hypothetical protein|uniref:Uncharacterized protein n=1 Tax=Dokdonella koreensis DS-123 TaxID=1300342 RepID=A0A160DUH8_9GAMM|nr:hypothetical protein [Dokdonella koreensis]ANB17691.1 Hypothetical protein I596_1667 [Dokdonella koreensis DS-123]
MRLVIRIIALSRATQLRRQFREVDKAIEELTPNARKQLAALTMREFSAASKSEFPHLYATPAEDKYRPWGAGTEIGLERMRSENPQVRMRGIALWLTVAYHETKDSPFERQQEMHRLVLRALRALKETVPPAELNQWFGAGAKVA